MECKYCLGVSPRYGRLKDDWFDAVELNQPSDEWIERMSPGYGGHHDISAKFGDTCCDDRGPEYAPFRVMIWHRATSGNFWSAEAAYATQGEAEDRARLVCGEGCFHGTTRFVYPLP